MSRKVDEAQRVEGNRSVSYEFDIAKVEDDNFHGERTVQAVLSISHHKAGYNYFSGERTTEDYFSVSLRTQKRGYRNGFMSTEFSLFDGGLGLTRIAAGNRYSAKKLREAEAEGVEFFEKLYAEGHEQVLAFFTYDAEAVAA